MDEIEMDDRVYAALEEMEHQCQERAAPPRISNYGRDSIDGLIAFLRPYIWSIREDFRFLKVFLDCIQKWSDDDGVVPNLGSLSIKIQARVDEIGYELMENSNLQLERASPKWVEGIFNGRRRKNEIKYVAERVSKLEGFFSGLKEKIVLLNPEIREVCERLSTHSLQFHSPLNDFGFWKKFVHSLHSNLYVLQSHSDFDSPPDEQIEAFREKLTRITGFLDHLQESCSNNHIVEDVMMHVGSVVLSVALLSCKWWAWEFDPNMKENVTIAILDFNQKIDCANPEFVGMNLRLLKSLEATTGHETLKRFVKYLLPPPQYYMSNHFGFRSLSSSLREELISLVASVLYMPEGYAENVERFLSDAKAVVMEVAPLDAMLCSMDATAKPEIETMILNLFAKIWLIKIEIFLREQLTTGDDLQLSIEEQIAALSHGARYLDLEERLRFIRGQIKDSPRDVENVNQILTLIEEVARVLASLNHSFHTKDITKKKVRNILSELLLKVMLFKSESNFLKLQYTNQTLMIFATDRMKPLHEGLKFLMMFVINQPEGDVDVGIPVFAHIEELTNRVIALCYSFPTSNITEEFVKNVNLLLSGLLDEIRHIMVELKGIYLHVPRSNFPKTNGLSFIDSLLINKKEFLNSEGNLSASVKYQIKDILADLEFLRFFLCDILEQDVEGQELKDLGSRVVEVAYEAEYFIDLIMVETDTNWQNLLWLYNLSEDIKLLKLQVPRDYEKKTNDVREHNVIRSLRHMKPWDSSPRIDEIVVGLNDQEEVIIDRLIGGFLQQDIVSIIGMPGIGKTTLAKKVYNSSRVEYHFHIRAWCCVSEVYKKRELLLEILNQITVLTEYILQMSDEDLELKLFQLLKQKRYLIVMDDMWNSGAWDDLGRPFPNDGNGSRILITSRLRDVALRVRAHSDPHTLRLLSDAESWKLLQMKIFHEKQCPVELMEVGKKIAMNCKGLPLAVVAIAGLLRSTDRQQRQWEEIADNLSSLIVDDPSKQCLDILELSYKHLPDYLKACFLYFGAFREDEEIPIQKLIRLWIAEGFVQNTELKSLEDLAEDYLKDLISRSLVTFVRPSSNGGVKACRVHDMLRHLCLLKAKEENFLQRITRSDEPNASYDGFDYGVDFDSFSPSNLIFEDHRLFICSKRKHFVMSRPFGPHVRSLIFSATNDLYPRCPYDISFISDNFKLLKVLDLECINMGSSFPNGIELLVHLRYLAVSGDIDFVPSSIANLRNLVTFLVKGLKGKVQLPETIWCMARLRHIHVSNLAVFNLQYENLGNSYHLDNLVTLSSLFLCYGENTNNILRQFPNLQKLGCIFSESWDNSQNCNLFPRLEVLTQLESLKISYHGRILHPGEFNFPLNLKKLTLSNFRLPWNHISAIGRLQNLEVLKLQSRAFEGQTWDMIDGEFLKLKFLKLDTLNIAQWNAYSDHLPNLQRLVLRCCKQLEEVPSSFAEIPTLQMIEVQWCGDSCVESVRKIREEGDEVIKVTIMHLSNSELLPSF